MEEAQLIAQGGAAREDVIVLDLSGEHGPTFPLTDKGVSLHHTA